MHLTVGILYHDSDRFAARCLETVTTQKGLGQIGQDWQLVCLDNGSHDAKSFEALRGHFPQVSFKHSGSNLGFGAGHNLIMREYPAELHAVLNIDLLLAPDFLRLLVATLQQHHRAGSAIGKLLQWDTEQRSNDQRTTILDSVGIGATRSHHFFDIGQREEDHGQYDAVRECFGGSGAAVVYRRSALEDVAHSNGERREFFDETFTMYKEDIDLAYRLQARGWHCLYEPRARGWHARTLSVAKRRSASARVRTFSIAHESLLLRKHRSWWPFGVRVRTGLRQTAKWAYLLTCEPRVFLGARRLIRKLRAEAVKRRSQAKHNVSYAAISHLFS